MASEDTNTSTSSTSSSNKNVTATLNNLLGGINTAYKAGAPATPNYSTFSPAGSTTQGAWASSLGAANNPDYSNAVQGAINYSGGLASGQSGLNDPTYQALRAKAGNDAQVQLNGQANAAGRLGGGIPNQALGQGVTNALAGLDYQQYQNGIQNSFQAQNQLPGLFAASQAPSATQGAVGAAQDLNSQGILSGNYDLANRQNNNQTDWLSKLSGILQGNAQTAGTTTTNSTPSTPWWQSALGIGLQAL